MAASSSSKAWFPTNGCRALVALGASFASVPRFGYTLRVMSATSGQRPDLTRLARLSHVAVGDGKVQDLLTRYTEDAVAATGATRGFAALAEVESAGLALVAAAGTGWTEEKRRRRLDERHRTGTMTARVAATGKALRFDDIAKELEGYQPFFPDVRSALVVPIALESDERVRGVINLESDRMAAFSPEHEAFV